MAARRSHFSNDAAVRVFLGAQGFSDRRPGGRIDSRHFAKLVSRLRLLQIDSVNVTTRAHYMPVFARLGPYDRDAFDRWIYDSRNMFEYWCHEQSYAPMSFHPMMRTRMAEMVDHPWKRVQDLLANDRAYVEQVLDEIRDRGPLAHRELSDPGEKTGPWWGYGKGKVALEWLFATGQVCVSRRVNFQRFYDLTERVIPADILSQPDLESPAADRARVQAATTALGIGTVADLADFFRMKKPATNRAIDSLVAEGILREVVVEGWTAPAYVHADTVVPRARAGTALVAPFDSLVWDRARTERMFGFRYRIEIYTPAPKRKYGYYVLPFMVDGRLVGRVDAKADRGTSVLRLPGAFAEDCVDVVSVGRSLADELRSMATWLSLADIEIGRKGNLAASTRKAL